MADDVRISYSFELNPQGPSADRQPPLTAADELIAFTGCERVDLGNGSVLLLNRNNGRQTTVTAEVATALSYCTSFRTLGEHAAALVDTIPQLRNQLADVSAVLTAVRQSGVMQSARSVCEQLAPATLPRASLAPTRACIITCDRPAAVQRLLDSMLANGRLTGHDALFLVDDSRDPGNSELNRELVRRFNLTSPATMHYAGAVAQRSLLQQLLAARAQDHAAIRFLLDRDRWASRPSYGLARTVCLLLTVGYRCIVLDDDVLFRCVKPPATGAGISFGGGDSRELACFESETQLLQQADYLADDPFSGHARYLGLPLAGAIAELDVGKIDPAALHGVNAAMLNSLQADSPILVTQCGSWGDPGTVGSNWLYHLGADSIRRILAAPGGLAAVTANRYYWLGRTRPNISKMAVMSQATGLDNSQLLPPYFPVFRSEDYLFASMVWFLHPAAAVLDCNWSIPHLPLAQRGGAPGAGAVARGGLGLCGRYLADRAEHTAGVSAATRLAQLALLIREYSECAPGELLARFRTELSRERAGQLQALSRKLQQARELGSTEWQDFLQSASSEVARALQSPASILDVPGAPGELDEEALLARVQHALGEFGAALQAWPGIRDSAADITARMLAAGEFTA